jgi:hypothetical protein
VEPWEVAAREGVRETVHRYAHLVDSGRIEEVLALFAEDGTLEAGNLPPAHGRDAIRRLLLGAAARLAAATERSLVRHHVSNLVIDVTGPESATAAAYFLVVTERGPDHWGRYRDQLVQAGGHWLFRHRRVRTDGHAPGSWVAAAGPGPR